MGILLRPCCTFYICTASNTLLENRRHPFDYDFYPVSSVILSTSAAASSLKSLWYFLPE